MTKYTLYKATGKAYGKDKEGQKVIYRPKQKITQEQFENLYPEYKALFVGTVKEKGAVEKAVETFKELTNSEEENNSDSSEFLEDLKEEYKDKFKQNVPKKHKNDINWIKDKLK